MFKKLKAALFSAVITLTYTCSAHAGLILFTDRTAFENAVTSPLAFEGFNDKEKLNTELTLSNPRYRAITSHISEGEKSLSLFEDSQFTIWFDHDVFAIGFDVNELNVNNLMYSDSAGNEILDALKVTDIWNESTFFGVISDTALRSFSLTGSGDSFATYGFDALTYTAPTIAVPGPTTLSLIFAGLLSILTFRRRLI